MRSRKTPRRRAMGNYYRFSVFNVISFNFLAGNIIVLYALHLGASHVLVGVIAASYQMTFIFSLIGRSLIRSFGAVKLMGYFWMTRYLAMAPVLVTILPGVRSRPTLVLGIVTLCAFAFNVAKGIGIAAVRPIVGEIPPQRERGSFLSNQQLIAQLGAIGTGLVMAWLLGPDASVARYMLLLIVGMLSGFVAAAFALRLPEPEGAGAGFDVRFADGLKRTLASKTFRRLSAVNMLLVFAAAMVDAFLVVYFKDGYGYADRSVVLFIAAGNVGAAIMAVVARAVLDRTGAKPLLFTFAVIMAAVMVPVALAPSLEGAWVVLFPAIVYFFVVMGRTGVATTADSYFYTITRAEVRLDSGILFGLGSGAAGTFGSILGGIFLTGLKSAIPDHTMLPFTIYFASAGALMLAAVLLILRLEDVGAMPLPSALGVLVSPRDLRTIRLLNRLRRSRTEPEEQEAVRALRDTTSALALDELSQRIQSPSLLIRMEAISALRHTPLTREVEDLLIADVSRHAFTTAHQCAELLGAAGVRRALPLLRKSVDSPDYMLSAKSVLALAQLSDHRSIPLIERQLEFSPNARVAIYAAKALETLGSVSSLPVILRVLSRTAEPFQRDEFILSCARLLGFFDWFYPLYLEFLDEPREGLRSLADAAADASPQTQELARIFVKRFGDAVSGTAELVRAYLEGRTVAVGPVDVSAILQDALGDSRLFALERFRYLLLATLVALDRPTDGRSVVYNRHDE